MVRTRQIQCVVALHPPPPSQDIDLGVVKHVADVQGTGYIWRRNHYRKYGSWRIHIGSEELFLRPVFCPSLLDQFRFVCFWNFSRHFPRPSALDDYYTDAVAVGQIRFQRLKRKGLRVRGAASKREILLLLDFSLDQSLNNGTQKFFSDH